MLRKRIRQFFLTTVVGGLLFTYSAFSYSPGQMLQKVSFSPETVKEKLNQAIQQYNKSITPLCANCQLPEAPQSPAAPAVPQKEFVRINGKYYPFNPKHIYLINGEKIYFRDESHWYDEEGVQHSRIDPKSLKELVVNGPGAYAPQNLKNMMQTIQTAKENSEIRKQTLEQMAEEEKRFQKISR